MVLTRTSGPVAKIAVRRGTRILLLSTEEVLYATMQDPLAFVHTATDRCLTDRTVADLEASLVPAGFFA